MTKRPRKALIIGAGIAGPVTAILLRRAGIDAQLFEAWPYSTGIGGGLQIAPNGMHVLAAIGLAGEMIRRGSIAESFDFYSQSGKRFGAINRNMEQRFGQPAVNMRRATLNEAIVDKAWSEDVELGFEKRLVRIEDHADQPIVAHFDDGSSAEGFSDRCRRRALGGTRACGSGRPETVRYRADRLRRIPAEGIARWRPDRTARGNDVRPERVLRLRILQPRSGRRRDVVEHPARARH
jgi:2-polyprenyl-6-methoxyphenol hydroxylase-like FAD-dependent oxidoreductase